MHSPSNIEVKDKLKEAKPWMRRFARFGYIAKGLVFVMVGVLAALAAFGPKGDTTGPQVHFNQSPKCLLVKLPMDYRDWFNWIYLMGFYQSNKGS